MITYYGSSVENLFVEKKTRRKRLKSALYLRLTKIRKKSHSAEKELKGGSSVSSGFVCYAFKVKNKRGDCLLQ